MTDMLRQMGPAALLIAGVLPVAAQADTLDALPDLSAAAVSADDLAGERGGSLDLIQLSEVTENASLQNTSALGNTTGDNVLAHGAFAGATGFATVIQNTGNNVIIQDSTVVNVVFSQ